MDERELSIGLSPLARGTLVGRLEVQFHPRFIPAGAGNTSCITCSARGDAVYPRWRGEHTKPRRAAGDCSGLSPLARGTLQNKTVLIAFCRFIPAGAGNTKWQFWPLLIMAVYPRWRGEHRYYMWCRGGGGGLSPLARGTPGNWRAGTRIPRFIPAGAGNTYFLSSHESRYPVYPRWRGEHGKNISINNKRRRFIPAGAGNTRAAISR